MSSPLPMAPEPRPEAPDVATTRRNRRRTVLAWVGGVSAVLLLAVVGTVGYVYWKLNGNLTSRDVSNKLGPNRPADPDSHDQNIAVMGSDSRRNTDGRYGDASVYTTAQSDTLMVVHVSAGHRFATVLSIPRDSWVSLPACQEGDGTTSTPHDGKINEAFTLGSLGSDDSGGAACAIRTLEATTGLHIDHYVVVNFEGFKDMTSALGGVPVCLPEPIHDTRAHLDLPAGPQKLSGDDALGYVRARYSLGDGSDLGRITRQQQFMASMARTARSQLTNPAAIYRFLDAATKSVTTDYGSLKALYDVANGLRGIPSDRISFVTMPNVPRETVVPSDHDNVVWKQPEAAAVVDTLIHDRPAASASPGPSTSAGGESTGGSTVDPAVVTAASGVAAGNPVPTSVQIADSAVCPSG